MHSAEDMAETDVTEKEVMGRIGRVWLTQTRPRPPPAGYREIRRSSSRRGGRAERAPHTKLRIWDIRGQLGRPRSTTSQAGQVVVHSKKVAISIG